MVRIGPNSTQYTTSPAKTFARTDERSFSRNVASLKNMIQDKTNCSCESVREKLNLETCSRATMLINAFGQSAEQLQTCDQVQFTVGSLNDSFQIAIDTYVVSEICAPLQRQEIREAQYRYLYLQGIKLAESCEESEDMEMDLLVRGQARI